MTAEEKLEKRIKELEAENEELQNSDWIDEPIRTKPTAKYKMVNAVEDCTCGKARIVTRWYEVDIDG